MKRFRISLWSAIAAQSFAWAALFFLALWPYSYQGVSAIPVNRNLESTATLQRSESPSSLGQQDFNASLIDVNGPGVILALLIPVAITAVALNAVAFRRLNRGLRLGMLWGSTVLMLVFCVIALFSVGVFYVPAAIALIVAAISGLGRAQPQSDFSHP